MNKTNGNVVKSNPQGGSGTSNFLRLVVSNLANRLHKSSQGLMNETFNPLWNINAKQAQMIYDYARTGNFAQIQYLYNEIENCDPTMLVCVTRRCSAISELDWKVVRSDERLHRSADANLIKEQIECVETALAKIDNLPDALEHLALSAFRGFSILNIWNDAQGMPNHLECLDHWNICLDRRENVWLWNKDGVSYMNPSVGNRQMKEIPRDAMIAVTRKRQIDWPAMKIFLRNAVGERDWGRFLETYGLPPVIITMPEFTNQKDMDTYIAAAEQVFEGRNGVVPYGSQVTYASESRGTNPFTEFIEHQMKLFVLMATGGTLGSLAEATGIGSGASDAQADVWKQIVRSDIKIISNAINKQLCERIIKAHKDFKGKPILAEFQLDTTPKLTPEQILNLASTASSAGFEMDADEISKAIGFTVKKKVEGGGMGFNADVPPTPQTPSPSPDGGITPESSLKTVDLTFQEGEKEGDDEPTVVNYDTLDENGANSPSTGVQTINPNKDTPKKPAQPTGVKATITKDAENEGERLARSLQEDFKGVADEIVKILALPEEEQKGAAIELLGKIDSLVSDDPVMAEVIAEQMQAAFDLQMQKQPDGGAPTANKAVPNDINDFRDNWEFEDNPIVINECRVTDHLCRIHDKAKIEALKKKKPDEMAADGRVAIQKMLQDHEPVVDAFYRESLGPLDLEWGNEGTEKKKFSDGWGIAKISKKHSDALMKLPSVIAHGEIRKHPIRDDRVVIIKGKDFAIFQKDENGHYLFTGMMSDTKAYAAKMRRGELIETQK